MKTQEEERPGSTTPPIPKRRFDREVKRMDLETHCPGSTLSYTSFQCVTLGKSFNLSVPWFHHLYSKITIEPTS